MKEYRGEDISKRFSSFRGEDEAFETFEESGDPMPDDDGENIGFGDVVLGLLPGTTDFFLIRKARGILDHSKFQSLQ